MPKPVLPPHTPRPTGAPLPLAGIRVADFSHFIAGPFASMILADMGAEVIKIEKIDGGDDFRKIQPLVADNQSAAFLWCNRGKRSIALDLRQPEGIAVARDIIAKSDVLLENFSAGVMEKFGLDYAKVSVGNPMLIYCAVSAYGRSGPLKDRLGFDPVTQAESGFMSMNGYPEHPAVRTSPSIMDCTTAMMTSNAILGALFARARLGHGQYIENALFDSAVNMVGFHALNYLASGNEPSRFGNASRDTVPTASFETADTPVFVCCANDRTWNRLAERVIDRPDLANDAVLATTKGRVEQRDFILNTVQEAFRTQPSAYWLDRMRTAGVPAGPVASIAQAFGSEVMAQREMATSIPHPTAGTVPNVRLPFKLTGTPLADPVAAPMLGQHSDWVLREVLGYGDAKVEALRGSGAVGFG